PASRFRQRAHHLRTIQQEDAAAYFLHEQNRRVRRDATFSLQGRLYEVDPFLRGEQITVHYNPFTFAAVNVYHKGVFSQQAKPLNKVLNSNHPSNYEPYL